ncbi:MAG: response regulator [Cyanobacteria bacterium RI_101]|nr:response regulator [Cyanobacteria bacterium RI_101]
MAKILIIEDQIEVRENIEAILELEDFETLSADNGVRGVELARQALPDLILCDVMMPELDGYGVLESLRAETQTAAIPLILLTARSERRDLRRGMELGADDYLTKPFSLDELLAAIRTRLDKRAQYQAASAEEIQRLRRNITRALPHEFLTPLNGILGLSEILLSYYDTLSKDEVLEYIRDIEQSGQRLNHLVHNLLLYAELELLGADPERRRYWQERRAQRSPALASLRRVFQEKLGAYDRLGDGHLTLAPGIEEIELALAPEDYQKILEELLDNACKFSPPGTPITAELTPGAQEIALELRDRGRGMDSQQLAQIGAYQQFERQIYEQQGSGLGLIIAKGLTELYGGSLTLTSEPGRGATVALTLPRGLGDS